MFSYGNAQPGSQGPLSLTRLTLANCQAFTQFLLGTLIAGSSFYCNCKSPRIQRKTKRHYFDNYFHLLSCNFIQRKPYCSGAFLYSVLSNNYS